MEHKKPRKVMCHYCDKTFVPVRDYKEGDVFDCPMCGVRQTALTHGMYVWYIYWLPPVKFVLKVAWWIILVHFFFYYFILKFAFQALLGIAVYKGVKGAFKMGNNVLHGEPPLGRRK